MRRKSERVKEKEKATPEKKHEKATRRSQRHSRRRKKSESTSPERDESGPDDNETSFKTSQEDTEDEVLQDTTSSSNKSQTNVADAEEGTKEETANRKLAQDTSEEPLIGSRTRRTSKRYADDEGSTSASVTATISKGDVAQVGDDWKEDKSFWEEGGASAEAGDQKHKDKDGKSSLWQVKSANGGGETHKLKLCIVRPAEPSESSTHKRKKLSRPTSISMDELDQDKSKVDSSNEKEMSRDSDEGRKSRKSREKTKHHGQDDKHAHGTDFGTPHSYDSSEDMSRTRDSSQDSQSQDELPHEDSGGARDTLSIVSGTVGTPKIASLTSVVNKELDQLYSDKNKSDTSADLLSTDHKKICGSTEEVTCESVISSESHIKGKKAADVRERETDLSEERAAAVTYLAESSAAYESDRVKSVTEEEVTPAEETEKPETLLSTKSCTELNTQSDNKLSDLQHEDFVKNQGADDLSVEQQKTTVVLQERSGGTGERVPSQEDKSMSEERTKGTKDTYTAVDSSDESLEAKDLSEEVSKARHSQESSKGRGSSGERLGTRDSSEERPKNSCINKPETGDSSEEKTKARNLLEKRSEVNLSDRIQDSESHEEKPEPSEQPLKTTNTFSEKIRDSSKEDPKHGDSSEEREYVKGDTEERSNVSEERAEAQGLSEDKIKSRNSSEERLETRETSEIQTPRDPAKNLEGEQIPEQTNTSERTSAKYSSEGRSMVHLSEEGDKAIEQPTKIAEAGKVGEEASPVDIDLKCEIKQPLNEESDGKESMPKSGDSEGGTTTQEKSAGKSAERVEVEHQNEKRHKSSVSPDHRSRSGNSSEEQLKERSSSEERLEGRNLSQEEKVRSSSKQRITEEVKLSVSLLNKRPRRWSENNKQTENDCSEEKPGSVDDEYSKSKRKVVPVSSREHLSKESHSIPENKDEMAAADETITLKDTSKRRQKSRSDSTTSDTSGARPEHSIESHKSSSLDDKTKSEIHEKVLLSAEEKDKSAGATEPTKRRKLRRDSGPSNKASSSRQSRSLSESDENIDLKHNQSKHKINEETPVYKSGSQIEDSIEDPKDVCDINKVSHEPQLTSQPRREKISLNRSFSSRSEGPEGSTAEVSSTTSPVDGDGESSRKQTGEQEIPGTSKQSDLQEEPLPPVVRKRRWGASKINQTPKKAVLSISTDSLKELIPGAKPLPIAELRLSQDDATFRRDEAEDLVTEKDEPRSKERMKEKEKLMEKNMEKPELPARAGPHNINMAMLDDHRGKVVTRKISIVSDDARTMQRSPSPPRHKASSVLFITNLVRPFTVNQLKELLARTGKIVEGGFWIDKIKSKCFVEYETEHEAKETRHALHGVRWPVSNPKQLSVDFGKKEDMIMAKAQSEADQIPRKTEPLQVEHTVEGWVAEQVREKEREMREKERERARVKERQHHAMATEQLERGRTVKVPAVVREWDLGKLEQHSPNEKEFRHEEKHKEREKRAKRERVHRSSRTPSPHEVPVRKIKKKEEDAPAKLLDDLFRKTKSTPCIYWLPLTAEQIVVKEEMRRRHMAEHERRMAEMKKAERERERLRAQQRQQRHMPEKDKRRRRSASGTSKK